MPGNDSSLFIFITIYYYYIKNIIPDVKPLIVYC